MKLSEVVFLEVTEFYELHVRALEKGGGLSGVRDVGLLTSAVLTPRGVAYDTVLYPSLSEMAAVLGYGIVKNHAFFDGNKRTALLGVSTFLRLNGIFLMPGTGWVHILEAVADGNMKRSELRECILAKASHDIKVELG